MKYVLVVLMLVFIGCGEKKEEKSSAAGMKCGAGKCGANMFDGNSALTKKKKNILSQMRETDPRKECVIEAKTTKATYNCVRDPKGDKLILKCGTGKCGAKTKEPAMKCGSGKCGSLMK